VLLAQDCAVVPKSRRRRARPCAWARPRSWLRTCRPRARRRRRSRAPRWRAWRRGRPGGQRWPTRAASARWRLRCAGPPRPTRPSAWRWVRREAKKSLVTRRGEPVTRQPTRAPRAALLSPAGSARGCQPGQECGKGEGCAWGCWSRTGRLAVACDEPGLRQCGKAALPVSTHDCASVGVNGSGGAAGATFGSGTKHGVCLQAPALPRSAPDIRPWRLQAISVRPGGAAALLTPADGVVAALAVCISQSIAAPDGSAGLPPQTWLRRQPAHVRSLATAHTAEYWQMSAVLCPPSGVQGGVSAPSACEL